MKLVVEDSTMILNILPFLIIDEVYNWIQRAAMHHTFQLTNQLLS